MDKISIIITAIGLVYETLSRIIPTSKTWSIIGNVVNGAKKLSDFLDIRKKS